MFTMFTGKSGILWFLRSINPLIVKNPNYPLESVCVCLLCRRLFLFVTSDFSLVSMFLCQIWAESPWISIVVCWFPSFVGKNSSLVKSCSIIPCQIVGQICKFLFAAALSRQHESPGAVKRRPRWNETWRSGPVIWRWFPYPWCYAPNGWFSSWKIPCRTGWPKKGPPNTQKSLSRFFAMDPEIWVVHY